MHNIVYKYINEFIDEAELLVQIKEFGQQPANQKYNDDINQLIKNIEVIKDDPKNNTYTRYDKVYNLLIDNKTYLTIANELSPEDLMLMITQYIKARLVPRLSQEQFDDIVLAAINSGKDSKENCFRLAMNYQGSKLNFDNIVDHMIESKNSWFMIELIYAVGEVLDVDNVIKKIVTLNDKKFIADLLADNYLEKALSLEQINMLKDSAKE